MNMKQTLSKNQKGFTILELMIATMVFSVMLILASVGIIQIGRVYYKGITTNRTQETTRAIVSDISRNYQITPNTQYAFTAGNPAAVCVGSTRYTYKINSVVTGNQHALWADRLNPGGNCVPLDLGMAFPVDGNTDTSNLGKVSQHELLAPNMRLAEFSVTKSASTNSLTVKARVIYGDPDLSPDNQTCKPMTLGGQFCAAASLESFVKGRL